MSTPIDPGVDIGHVHLKVADIDRSLAFYCGVLGFEVKQRYRRAGGLHLGRRLSPPHRAEHLGVAGRLAAAAGNDRPLPRRDPLSRRARRWPTRSSASSRASVPLTGASDHGVSEAIYLHDPDGNGVELYRDRPRGGVAASAGRKGVAMVSEPLDLQALLAEAES